MIPILKASIEEIQKKHHLNTKNTQADIQNLLEKMEKEIQTQGNKALIHYTEKFDHVTLAEEDLLVTPKEIKQAYDKIDTNVIKALEIAKENIEAFHTHQKPNSWTQSPKPGIRYGNKYTPLNKVGLYVPGGRAPYPSTVLMDSIPAKVAGVKTCIMTTPPQKDGTISPQILVAADLCKIETILKAGGAQAIFALANGTETIPKVDKIVGPGNMYVDLAKQKVYGKVDIDKPAGPSDVLVYITDEKYAAFAASELLAQLEHDPNAMAIALSENQNVLEEIQKELKIQFETLSRKEILLDSLKNSVLFKTNSEKESINYINEIAAEHLVLLIENAEEKIDQIENAGAIFCGPYTPVTLGDYVAGPNHVLPTSGAARFASPLGVSDFMKYSSILSYDKKNLEEIKETLKTLTELEGFDAHFNAVQKRFDKKG